jgi:phosphoglycerate kinase
MANFDTLDALDVQGKRVLVRSDLNVPLRDGRVTDETRVRLSAQTIREIADRGGRVVVLSHFGRPQGKSSPDFSLQPVADMLSRCIGRPVTFARDCVGTVAKGVVDALAPGDVALLENVRFHAQEEHNEPAFAQMLADLGDLYVNDAFSAAHRAHASTEGVARILPSVAGRLLEAELNALGKALEVPTHPVAAVIGGAKVSTKLGVLKNLVRRVDVLVIGGGMANTFLAAQGYEVGSSLCEHDLVSTARAVLDEAQASSCTVMLPTDVVVAQQLKECAVTTIVPVTAVPRDHMILDMGPQSVADVMRRLKECRTVVWNGPLGAFEIAPFDVATVTVAQSVADLTGSGVLLTVAGGGDTIAALRRAGVHERFSYVSSAGGAFLEWLEGKPLPGVEALKRVPVPIGGEGLTS